ncbi:MAG: phosphate ABC transporter permease PstA [Verrucomicrobiales bacterium]|jgi:phosphate transport system permease protein|nr:phosphate ABC transporter permease PstA [Verrucomicrobiales bacterium]
MNADGHIFCSRWTRAKTLEAVAFGLFRAATYVVIAAALYVFGDIAFKGGAVVFQKKAPFVNVPFLTESPETLDIFTLPADGEYRLDAGLFKRLRDANAEVRFKSTVSGGTVTFSVPVGASLHVGNTVYRALMEANGVEPLEHTTQAYAAGGIFPAIVGTVLLVVGSMTIALTLGILCAVYLSEYSRHSPFINFVRLSIVNLAGVPSIVFGMWGAAMFVILFKWNVSLLAGWCTLAFMVLPIIITGSEESLRAVPKGFRDGSLALGATQWQTVTRNVLPYALPGILTSSIMGIARIAGETAAIMFTAAFVISDKLPWQVTQVKDFFFSGVMALPYHIFVVSAKVPQNEYTARVQYGTTFVFMVIIALIALTSILLRARARSKYRW